MPRIPDQWLRSIAYLFASKATAEQGSGGGTGFLVRYRERGYMVANIHNTSVHAVARLCTQSGSTLKQLPQWTCHGQSDIAVAPLETDAEYLNWSDLGPTRERMIELNVGVGDDVFMIGRFAHFDSAERNEPTVCFGNIAKVPGTPLMDGRNLPVVAYVVELRSISGFSGSPVFVHVPGGADRADGRMQPFYSPSTGLLGVVTGHLKVKLGEQCVHTAMSIVAPYFAIEETLEAASKN
jgi:hypothetical protein